MVGPPQLTPRLTRSRRHRRGVARHGDRPGPHQWSLDRAIPNARQQLPGKRLVDRLLLHPALGESMSLTIPAVPQEAVTALAAALPKIATSPAVAANAPRAAAGVRRFMTARAAISLPFFVLDLSDVRKGTMAARQVGWRHLLPTGDPAGPVLAETAIRDSNQHVFAGVTESPFVNDLEDQLLLLLTDPTVP